MRNRVRAFLVALIMTTTAQAQSSTSCVKIVDAGIDQVIVIARMKKNYVMMKMNNKYKNPKEKLAEAVASYEKGLEMLTATIADADIKKLLEKNKSLWVDAKALMQAPPSKDFFKLFNQKIKPLRSSMREIIRAAKSKSGTDLGENSYLAGKLSVIPQKIANLYMMKNYTTHADKMGKAIDKQIALYKKVSNKLTSSANVPDSCKAIIQKLDKELNYFKFLNSGSSTFVPALIYRKTNKMSTSAKKLRAGVDK